MEPEPEPGATQMEPEPEPGADAGLDQRPPVLWQEKPPTASEEEEWEAQVYADPGLEEELEATLRSLSKEKDDIMVELDGLCLILEEGEEMSEALKRAMKMGDRLKEIEIEIAELDGKPPPHHVLSKTLEETHKALEEKEAEELACGVCSGKVADAIIKPCNHISCCLDCAGILKALDNPCPECRGPIEEAEKVFITAPRHMIESEEEARNTLTAHAGGGAPPPADALVGADEERTARFTQLQQAAAQREDGMSKWFVIYTCSKKELKFKRNLSPNPLLLLKEALHVSFRRIQSRHKDVLNLL